MRFSCLLFLLVLSACELADNQKLTGPELVRKSIEFHDPQDQWKTFRGRLTIQDSLPPGRTNRTYDLCFDNAESTFSYKMDSTHFLVWQDSVQLYQGTTSRERALRLRDYYTYLWGLPMKLLDPSTKIDVEVGQEVLLGSTYHVVRVPYEKDTWYFYFNPETYALEAYKFYQDERAKKGELILLEGILEVEGLKIPKNRMWHRTAVDEFLGLDQLIEGASLD